VEPREYLKAKQPSQDFTCMTKLVLINSENTLAKTGAISLWQYTRLGKRLCWHSGGATQSVMCELALADPGSPNFAKQVLVVSIDFEQTGF
jgi:hypothetical protein